MPAGRSNVSIVVDVNVWVSVAIGKRMQAFVDTLLLPNVKIFSNQELLSELKTVLNKPKLRKYISRNRAIQTLNLIKQTTETIKVKSAVKIARDAADDYLLALSKDSNADYLVTGDKDLLVLKKFNATQIISVSDFIKLFAEDKL